MAIKRGNSKSGTYLFRRATQLADSVSSYAGARTQVLDGYLLEGKKVGGTRFATVLDLPQYVLCPNLMRVPIGAGNATFEGLVFPSDIRDLWQPDYLPDLIGPRLPTLKREAWRLATNTGYAFGGEGVGWEEVISNQSAANVPYDDGVGNTVHQVNGVGVIGFYNAATPSLQRFFTRLWARVTSATQETVLSAGAIPVTELHTRAIIFDTAFVDTLVPGWVAIPRASPEFTSAAPPAWSASQGLWGRSYRIQAVDLPDGSSKVRYVLLARLFANTVNGNSDRPYFEPGAVLVATADVAAARVDGVLVHSGAVLSSQVYQTVRPSTFSSPEACAVNNGVHVLLHARVIRFLESPHVLYGENTYTVVYAKAVGESITLNFMAVDRDDDTRASRHFYGGATPDGVTSYFLYPTYNPGSPVMSVLACNGATVALTDVVTPSQFQLPGWGYVATTGLVCNIGAGRLGFVVTLAGTPEVGSPFTTPFDVTFCTYNTLTATVAVVGQITLATVIYVSGYPTTAGGIGAVTVVQEEVRDEGGAVLSSAVLLWTTSSGLNTGAGGQNFVGATYVSYDSGVTWHHISDTVGDFRGVVFVGSQLRPVKPGHAWIKPPVSG
jgi:hypothetical protein